MSSKEVTPFVMGSRLFDTGLRVAGWKQLTGHPDVVVW
jgi:hypothetical protein